MSGRVTDFSIVTLRISQLDFHRKLNDTQREMLHFYSARSWNEADTLCFEIAGYRLDEINGKGSE